MSEMSLNNCVLINEVLVKLGDWTVRPDFQIVIGSLYAIIFTFGFIANSLILAALLKYKNLLGDFHNEFIMNLAMANLLKCIVSLPATVYEDFYKVWPFGSTACSVIPFVRVFCGIVHSLTLSVIGIDRYFRVLKRQRIERMTSRAIAVVTWITSFFISIPLAVKTNLVPGIIVMIHVEYHLK